MQRSPCAPSVVDMPTVECTITVRPGVEEVFTYFADFTHTNEWDPGTVSTTLASGDGGVGTTWDNVSEFMKRKTELSYELVVHEPYRRLVFRGTNKSVTATDTMTFTAEGDGTRIDYRADFDFQGFAKVAAVGAVPLLNRLADKTADQIKASLG